MFSSSSGQVRKGAQRLQMPGFGEDREILFLEADSLFTSQGLKGGGSSCLSFEEASPVLGRRCGGLLEEGHGGWWRIYLVFCCRSCISSFINSFLYSVRTCVHLNPALPGHFRSPEGRRPVLNGQRIT